MSSPLSPFFSRTYGGFTRLQRDFIQDLLGHMIGATILDPMAGQGDFLGKCAVSGFNVILGDINPALLCLAGLRSPALLRQADDLYGTFRSMLEPLDRASPKNENEPLLYADDWVSSSVRGQLVDYASAWRLESCQGLDFFRKLAPAQDPVLSLALGIPLLAARSLVSFRTSDNATWIKRGGLSSRLSVPAALLKSLDDWYAFIKNMPSDLSVQGDLELHRIDIVSGEGMSADLVGAADLVVTSPPYANRLDYARLWTPEVEILGILLGVDLSFLKKDQLGSNIIRGRATLDEEESVLPEPVRDALVRIRSDARAKASNSYYYPFFRNYAVAMRRAAMRIASLVAAKGMVVVFVRDTVRKDVLFPTADLIASTLSEYGLQKVAPVSQVVRRHIGLRRRREAHGLHGLAQQEWWLIFKKA